MISFSSPFKHHRKLTWSLVAGCLLLTLLSTSCQQAPTKGWEQIDLCTLPVRTDNLGETPRDLEARITHVLLGEHLRKRRARVADDASGTQEQPLVQRAVGGSILAIEARTDVLLRWEIELGEEPYFAFRPLSRGTTTCLLDYRVGIIDAEGVLREIYKEAPDPEDLSSPPQLIRVDLGAFANQAVELLATVSPEETCDTPEEVRIGIWGGPVVFSKKTPPRRDSQDRLNLILIGLDTVRADVLGAYGAEPSVTPSLDALATESDVWLNAFSTFNATNPSFSSMLTGLYGKRHGVYDLQTPLPEHHVTLAEILKEQGYETAAVLSARHLGDRQSGLAQGFDTYLLPTGQFSAELSVQHAMSWIKDRDAEPFFLWLHLFDPHTPHTPPEPFSLGFGVETPPDLDRTFQPDWLPFRLPGPIERYTQRFLGAHRALYFGELAYTDFQLGRLFAYLQSRNLFENSIVVVVADHGENLGEYGIAYRHSGLWDTTTHVPMMIRWPGQTRQERRIEPLVQTLDLFPTLLDRLGLDVPAGTDGRLLAGLEGAGEGRRVIFAEHSSGHGAMIRSREHLLQRIEDHQYIPSGVYFYDLENDPEQKNNLAGVGLAKEKQLLEALDAWLADRSNERPPPVSLSPEEIEQLRSLGYATP